MGKRIIQQRRGRGTTTYRSPGHRFAGKISYPSESAKVVDIIHDPARDVPLAKLKSQSGSECLIIASEGMKIGDIVSNTPAVGNISSLSNITKGSSIFAIETCPGSGPQLCRSAGTCATIISQSPKFTIIQMPSKQFKKINPNCLATVGIPAGGGQKEKRFFKAGQNYFKMQARNKLWPRTSAGAMNPVNHPFGGKTGPGQSKSVSRNRPPGAKVGSVASRRTGRRKK